jgi:adenylate cyclase
VKAVTPNPAADDGKKTDQGVFHFAGFTLDPDKGLLSRGQAIIELRPKSYALLCYLVGNAGRVLSKDELLDAIWDDVTVTEDSLTQCIRDIRLALGDDGLDLVKTLPRRGYLFEGKAAAENPAAPQQRAGERPKLAVLPFRNLGGRQDQDYLSAGIAEDIITALARFSSLTVMGHHAVNRPAIADLEPQKAAAVLGVDYVVDGSVRFAPDRIRITARLLEALSGATLWAENFDRQPDSIFEIQDEVVNSIVAALDDRLVTTGASLARHRPAATWSAYDYLLQGRDLCNQHREVEAIPLFAEAVRRDPSSAHAHAWHAIAQAIGFAVTASRDYLDNAAKSASLALRCDDRDDAAQWSKGMSLMWAGQWQEASPYLRRAMQLNPANIQIRGDHANLLRYMGRLAEALAEIDSAIEQDPFAPLWFHGVRGGILLDMKDYAGALAELRRLPYQNPHVLTHQLAAFAWLGDDEGVSSTLRDIRGFMPGISIAVVEVMHPYGDSAVLAHLLEGLRRAGLPET